MGVGDLKFGRGHFENCIRPFNKHQKWMQMILYGFFDTFQPRIDFSYGLDVEIRPKLTPGAGTQVQYSTALWLHGHANPSARGQLHRKDPLTKANRTSNEHAQLWHSIFSGAVMLLLLQQPAESIVYAINPAISPLAHQGKFRKF